MTVSRVGYGFRDLRVQILLFGQMIIKLENGVPPKKIKEGPSQICIAYTHKSQMTLFSQNDHI